METIPINIQNMSTLYTKLRPIVVFDAENKQHRQHFYQFLKTKSWGNCPVRFTVGEGECSNIVGVMQRQLALYYTSREFDSKKER